MLPASNTRTRRGGTNSARNTPGGRSRSARSAGLPDPEGGDFAPFFKIDDAPGNRFSAVITDVPRLGDRSKFGQQVIVPIRIGKADYVWGIRIKSQNYRLLIERFGKREANWKGKKLKCEVRTSQSGNDFVAIL